MHRARCRTFTFNSSAVLFSLTLLSHQLLANYQLISHRHSRDSQTIASPGCQGNILPFVPDPAFLRILVTSAISSLVDRVGAIVSSHSAAHPGCALQEVELSFWLGIPVPRQAQVLSTPADLQEDPVSPLAVHCRRGALLCRALSATELSAPVLPLGPPHQVSQQCL